MNKSYRRPTRVAVGLPGQPPSREARLLASAPDRSLLPAGVWHISDHGVADLAGSTPVIQAAVHQPTGARFRLVRLPAGRILGFEVVDEAARALLHAAWSDPTRWVQAQEWRIVPSGSATRVDP